MNTRRSLLVSAVLLLLSLPAFSQETILEDDFDFADLDGSTLDDDGTVNGVVTILGDLVLEGEIHCDDDLPAHADASACPIELVVSGNLMLRPGSGIYAENRRGDGDGGAIELNVGGDLLIEGGATISSSKTTFSQDGAAGSILARVAGGIHVMTDAEVAANNKAGPAGTVRLFAEQEVAIDGLVSSGPSTHVASHPLSDLVLSGGNNNQTGASIQIVSTSLVEPGIVVGSDGIVVSQGRNGGADVVTLEAFGLEVRGLVASVGQDGGPSRVSLRSGTGVLIDGGRVRADATHGGPTDYGVDIFARGSVRIFGPASDECEIPAVSAVPGSQADRPAGGTVRILSLDDEIHITGCGINVGSSESNRNDGGAIDVKAAGEIVLNGASLIAAGDYRQPGGMGVGGTIDVSSLQAGVEWEGGMGDVRPETPAAVGPTTPARRLHGEVGAGNSGLQDPGQATAPNDPSPRGLAEGGSISVRYCTDASIDDSEFPALTTLAAPDLVQACPPGGLDVPAGVTALPDPFAFGVRLDPHPRLTNDPSVQIAGTVLAAESVEISGPDGVTTVAVTDGRFAADIDLVPNRINTLHVTGIAANGGRSLAMTTAVIQDEQPPSVFIDFPSDGSQITGLETDVAGRVADTLSGFMGLEVVVNGVPAIVESGIGTNGTFLVENVPLIPGQQTLIEAIATDELGNSRSSQISVDQIEIPPDAPRIEILSGMGQSGSVGSLLTEPLVVRVTHGDGTPFADKIVTFTVVRSDGGLAATATSEGSATLQVRTDAFGEATAFWRLGSDSGCGNNRVEVTSRDVLGTTFFCASAGAGVASQINVGTGDNQRGEAGGMLAEPLAVWVSDGRNGVGGVPVTFVVTEGQGHFGGPTEISVLTSPTGHASVPFATGPDGRGNHVLATFPGNQNAPASFFSMGVKRDPDLPTTLEVLVVDNATRPIGGAECGLTVNGQSAGMDSSGLDGRCFFAGVPAGPAHLSVDGLVASAVDGNPVDPGSFPSLVFELTLVPNAANTLPVPVRLPALDPTNAVPFDNTTETVLTVQGIAGLEMRVKAGSMTRADGSVPSPSDPAILALNQVHFDDVPMPMPDGAAPPFAWTLQPAGAHFDPPIEIQYPNMSGLPPGSIAYFLSFDHETNRFEIVATGQVTADGASIISDPGAGLSVAGWGCNCPPYSVAGECCKERRECVFEGSITAGTPTVSDSSPAAFSNVTFSVPTPTDSGGGVEIDCPGGMEGGMSQAIAAVPVTVTYRVETPDGAPITGDGTSVSVSMMKCGTYQATFEARAERECAPASISMGPVTASVDVDLQEMTLTPQTMNWSNLKDAVKFIDGIVPDVAICSLDTPSLPSTSLSITRFEECCDGDIKELDKFTTDASFPLGGIDCSFPIAGIPLVATFNADVGASADFTFNIDLKQTCTDSDVCGGVGLGVTPSFGFSGQVGPGGVVGTLGGSLSMPAGGSGSYCVESGGSAQACAGPATVTVRVTALADLIEKSFSFTFGSSLCSPELTF